MVAVTVLSTAAATLVAFENRPADHHYTFFASYGNSNGVPYTLLLPLPAEADFRAGWRFLGNGTAGVEASPYGPVLRIAAWSNITVSANFSTWRDLSAAFSTEGTSAGGRPAARVNLNSSAPTLGSSLQVTLTKVDPTWTLTRAVEADLFEGWNAIDIRETLVRTTAR